MPSLLMGSNFYVPLIQQFQSHQLTLLHSAHEANNPKLNSVWLNKCLSFVINQMKFIVWWSRGCFC